jgi:hypothetical protein
MATRYQDLSDCGSNGMGVHRGSRRKLKPVKPVADAETVQYLQKL